METSEPFVLVPETYWLPISGGTNFYYWCKLGDVVELACRVSSRVGTHYRWSMEKLVREFAAAAHINRPVPDPDPDPDDLPEMPKKFFRYSLDGRSLRAKEVPYLGNQVPPYFNFELDEPLSPDTFVPLEWATRVLLAVFQGAYAVAQWNDRIVGFVRDDGVMEHTIDIVWLEQAGSS